MEKRTRRKGNSVNKPEKKKSHNRIVLNVVLILVLALAALFFLKPVIFTDTRAIMVDGKRFAFIKAKDMDSEQFNLLLTAKLKERFGKNVEINEEVTLKPAHAAKKNIASNVDVVIAQLCDNLTVKGECGAIVINGEMKFLVKSVVEAEEVLNSVLAFYTPEQDEESEDTVIGTEFIDEVSIEPYFADDSQVLSATQAYDGLTKTEEKTYDYVVKKGDSFNGIAASLDMKEAELMALNPDITEKNKTMLQIGQVLKVKADVPIYGVYTIMQEMIDETIDIPEQEIENLSQHTSYRRVVSEGKTGKKKAAYKVYYENGMEVKREPDPDNDKVIVEPEPRKVEVGVLETTGEVASSVGNFIYPIKQDAYFSSGYGSRNYGSGRHFGIDIAAPSGTEIFASDGGVVTEAGWNNGGYGYWVVIDHLNGFKSVYAHNSAVAVHAGQWVHQGQLIANVGSTGDSTGSHLHFEIRLLDEPLDPLRLLA